MGGGGKNWKFKPYSMLQYNYNKQGREQSKTQDFCLDADLLSTFVELFGFD